jgi:hypothetical protein
MSVCPRRRNGHAPFGSRFGGTEALYYVSSSAAGELMRDGPSRTRPASGARHRVAARVPNRRRLLRSLLAAVSVALIATAGAFAFRAAHRSADPVPPLGTVHTSAGAPSAPAAPATPHIPAPPVPAAAAEELVSSFAELAQSVSAVVGMAIRPVGENGVAMNFGSWTSGPAWSTSKVPLVLAALHEENEPSVSAAMEAAITRSDNGAAEQIWATLGDPVTAASKVDQVLRETGDQTVVQSQRIRPEFTAFGQTLWSLADQVLFLSHAACDPRTAPVLDLMNRIETDQQWGLGSIHDARFKGGWGPSVEGRYLVRQFGLVPTPTGTIAVALAAEPASGSFSDGVQALDVLTDWVTTHVAQMPGGRCG